MNRSAFFSIVKDRLYKGKLDARTDAGIDTLLDVWFESYSEHPLAWLAYCLGTTYHETAFTMLPIREYGGESYFTRYDGKLGNNRPGDGYKYRGAGYVQLTGRSNFRNAGQKLGIPLEDYPELALDPKIAAKILYRGMIDGWFTGKKLGDYINSSNRDFVKARKIVNGMDKASQIAKYAEVFFDALNVLMETDPEVEYDEVARITIPMSTVKAYQKANALTPDGVIGPKTWARLIS